MTWVMSRNQRSFGREQFHDLGEQPAQGAVFLAAGMGLDQGIWKVAQLPEAVSQSQGQEAGCLLEGSLGYGPSETVAKPEHEQAVAVG